MNEPTSWLSSGSLTLLLATVGGVFVAVGLIVEKLAEKIDERFSGGYKAHGCLEWFGWGLLMFGIFIEIADAGWTASEINRGKRQQVQQANQLLSVSNSAAMNSPFNSPISSVKGDAFIIVNRESAANVAGLAGRRAVLNMMTALDRYSFPGYPLEGRIEAVWTNASGDVSIVARFDKSGLRTTGPFRPLTFNSFNVICLNLFPDRSHSSQIVIREGSSHLEINSEYDARFEFAIQTNIWLGVIGYREKDVVPPAYPFPHQR